MNSIKTYNLIRTESKINCFKFVMGSTFVSFLYSFWHIHTYTYIYGIDLLAYYNKRTLRVFGRENRGAEEKEVVVAYNAIKGNCFEFVNVRTMCTYINMYGIKYNIKPLQPRIFEEYTTHKVWTEP